MMISCEIYFEHLKNTANQLDNVLFPNLLAFCVCRRDKWLASPINLIRAMRRRKKKKKHEASSKVFASLRTLRFVMLKAKFFVTSFCYLYRDIYIGIANSDAHNVAVLPRWVCVLTDTLFTRCCRMYPFSRSKLCSRVYALSLCTHPLSSPRAPCFSFVDTLLSLRPSYSTRSFQ